MRMLQTILISAAVSTVVTYTTVVVRACGWDALLWGRLWYLAC